MKFTKMQGCGNDYVYVDCTREMIENASHVAIKVSDRHFGIGSDGLILIASSEVADFQMIMYNADGSRGEMCGNGIRCVGKFVYDKGLTNKKVVTVETLAGIKTLELNVVDGKVKTTKKGTKAYMKLLTQLDTVLSDYSLEDESGKKYDTNEKRIYAPNVVAIVNGKPEKLQEGISSDLKDPYGKITNKMKQDSIDQLKCIFKCMEKAGICTKESAC